MIDSRACHWANLSQRHFVDTTTDALLGFACLNLARYPDSTLRPVFRERSIDWLVVKLYHDDDKYDNVSGSLFASVPADISIPFAQNTRQGEGRALSCADIVLIGSLTGNGVPSFWFLEDLPYLDLMTWIQEPFYHSSALSDRNLV